ncbi:MAG TPA: hypothetical protein VGU90_09035 [Terriglobales bacterium]|nr:hypothetical protein [Terriglobales bacterium]
MAKTRQLKLDLLNNGIDFIRSGVEFFLHDVPDPRLHKYAVLHLFSGLLLILKERLRREHPSLVFKDVTDAGKSGAKTIDFDELIARLEACANVTLGDRRKKLLRKAQQVRNALEHYEFELNLQEAQALIGKLSEFAYCFMDDELDERLEGHVPHAVWYRMQELRGIAKRIEAEQEADWQIRADKYVDLDDEELVSLANSIEPYHPKHNPDPDELLNCGECYETSVIVPREDGDIGVCTNPECRTVHKISYCLKCGCRLAESETFCENCEAYLREQ